MTGPAATEEQLADLGRVLDESGPSPVTPAAGRPAADNARTFEGMDGHYRLVFHTPGILFDLDHVQRRFGELTGELRVSCDLPGAAVIQDNVLSAASFSVSNLRARQERATLLAARAHTKDLDWFAMLEEFCHRVMTADRAGTPAVHLRDVARPGPEAVLKVDGITLLRDHPTIFFGDGGAAKSYLALYSAGRLRQQGLRVLFADWELGAEDHRDRLERIFGSAMPDLLYCRCDKPLVAEADRLRRIMRDEHIDYWIADSVAFACDGPPEAAEVASAYFRAVRSLETGSLHVAHISKAEGSDRKPFGSVFWANGARMTWFVERADESPDGRLVTIGLFNRKANLGPLRPAVGLVFTFDDDRTVVQHTDLAAVPDLADRLPLWQRIRPLVTHGAKTLDELAEELAAPKDSIKKAVQRSKTLFAKVTGSDGVPRIALVERRER